MPQVPKIVVERLQATGEAVDHLDANLLSGFVEASLSRSERLEVLQHLSRCHECREVVALSTPEVAESIRAVRPFVSSWPVLRWGAAVACVVVVGAALGLHYRQVSRPPVETAAVTPPGSNASSPKATTLAQSQSGPSDNTAGANPAAKGPETSLMADASKGREMAELIPGRAKNALQETSPANPTPEPPATSVSHLALPLALTALPRWTLSSDGTLQRSLDSGHSWQTVTVAHGARFRALAANKLDIWVGGLAGALYHSADAGQHWTKVQPVADGEPLIGDIIGVEFTDPAHGKVTTSSQESWTTADAGETWQKK
jgi:hypothetical protein